MVNYLLGEMSEDEQAQFEDCYFLDDDLFEQLIIVKEELTDAYVRDHLGEREREQFERYFLNSPHRREQVAFALSLRQKLSEPTVEAPAKATARSWRQTWFGSSSPRVLSMTAAALLLLVFGVGWLIRENRKLHDDLSILRAEQKEWLQREQEWQRQLAELRAQSSLIAPPTSPKTVAPPTLRTTPDAQFLLPAIVLMPGARSRSGVKEVSFVPVARRLPLRLAVNREPTSREYTAVLQSADGREVARRSHLRATNSGRLIFVEAVFSTALLEVGEYTMKLFGTGGSGQPEELSDYSFRVVKR